MSAISSSYLQVRDIWLSYGESAVLKAVNLEICRGEFLTLLGPSGSGKSTLLMVLAGFNMPSRGSLSVDGRDLIAVPPHRRDIGFVFQSHALFPHLTVLGNVLFPLRVRRITGEAARHKALQSLERVGLAALANRPIDTLSGGQRQRVAFARAVVAEPRLLLMDEPLSALDKNLREEMQVQIRELHDALGMTTVYVTHDQREAMTMADRIAVMNQGRIEQIDTPEAIYRRPITAFVANFMGQANVLPLDLFTADPSAATAVDRARSAGKKYVVVRAESFVTGCRTGSEPGISIAATLQRRIFHGDCWLLNLTAGRESLRASIVAREAGRIADLKPGETLGVWAALSDLWFIGDAEDAGRTP